MVIMHESMSPIRWHLLAVYIMIVIDAKGQVLKDAMGKALKMCMSTLYTCIPLDLHTQVRSLY